MSTPTVESVWDYPRPPRLERSPALLVIELGGHQIVETTRSLRVLETSHPPVHYVPIEDVADGVLQETSPGAAASYCEWKGTASYYDAIVPGTSDVLARVAWHYPQPTRHYAEIAGHVAFYPSRMDRCWLDGEQVQAQAGDFYGGWITSRIVGPFKGGPGTRGW
ncbi:MAG TPA: DUF427 domain-containing protein [Frankiaceae bacterium]|nr:DUF427 domain-containing protein [Frankiaceae bacterium]